MKGKSLNDFSELGGDVVEGFFVGERHGGFLFAFGVSGQI